MTTVMNWLNENRAVYFGNATSMREFRVQLRGNRSVLLFGAYLVMLIGVAMFVYSEAVGDQRMSIVEAQSRLQSFYMTVMELLAGTICVVAPALSATTVVLERQRRSLDLVFSAPVSPKYFLVGKMLSSYRYIWMLLVLSLPVTAACVVLGGASWGDVLGSYVLLSMQALVLTSISLLMSTLAPKPVSAVLWSYAACIPYLLVTASGAGSFLFGYGHGHSMEAPFFVALSPFMVIQAVGTYTAVGNFDVPNWIPALGVTLLITKIALLTAGSLLSPVGKEARSLRIHGFFYLVATIGLLGYYTTSSIGFSSDLGGTLGRTLAWVLMPLIVVLPFMTCYGYDGENRFKPNGMFKLTDIFKPTPATGLPYVLLLIGGAAVGLVSGFWIGVRESGVSFLSPATAALTPVKAATPNLGAFSFVEYFTFVVAFWVFFWSVGRLASSFGIGLRAARALQFGSFLLLCAIPVPVIITLDHASSLTGGTNIWSLWALRSIFNGDSSASGEAMTYAVILCLLAIPISFYAEARLKEMLEKRNAIRNVVDSAA